MVEGLWAVMRSGAWGRTRHYFQRRRHSLALIGVTCAIVLSLVALLVIQRPTGDVTTGGISSVPTANPDLQSLLITPQTLTWGGDVAIGAPYVFVDPTHPTQPTGLEADILTAIATRLHLHLRFKPTAWDGFPRALHARSIDLFADDVIPTELPTGAAIYTAPYLVTSNQIVVRAGDTRFTNLASLRHHLVGVVTGDRAQAEVMADTAITLVPFAQQLPFEALAAGRIDAVVISAPLARWFGARDPLHRFTVLPGETDLAPVALALAISHVGSFALRDRISQVLQTMRCDGTLKKILARWGLTTPIQQWAAIPVAGTC